MGLLSDIGDFISSAASTVADGVEDVVTTVTDTVADAAETVGNLVQDGLDAIGGVLDNIPVIGGFLGGVCRWAGDVVSGACDILGGEIKALGSIVAGVIGGAIKVLGGLLSLNGSLILEGLGDIGSGIGGAIAIIVLRWLEEIQIIIRPVTQLTGAFRERERKLTEAEKMALRSIFRSSLALYNIRVVEGHVGWFGVTNWSGFTVGNTVYAKATMIDLQTLVHECTHVWQYQNWGPRYLTDAIVAQKSDSGYNWGKEIAAGKTDWVDFNVESEARFVEDLFAQGELLTSPIQVGNGVFFLQNGKTLGRFVGNFGLDDHLIDDPAGTDFTAIANKTVAEIRGAINTRPSGLIP